MAAHLLLSLLALVLPLAIRCANDNDSSAATKSASVVMAEAQIGWLESKGGFYSSKLSIEPLFESDSPQVPLGVFAKENMAKGEKIIVVPRHCLLTAGPHSEDMCVTALRLVRERARMGDSEFEPYVSYLYSKESISLPSNWSPMGQKLIRKIRGKDLPPEDLTEVSFENHCGDQFDTTDELEFAYLSVVSRAWSDKLVPVYDMINHHSGRFANVDSTSIHGPEDVTVYATRDIQAGEQLHLSYMDCIDEQGYELEYVLPQMLRDFGFVDQYPQRWIFPGQPDDPEEDLVFDLDLPEEGDQEMQISWYTELPSPHQIVFLQEQLLRLRSLRPHVLQVASQLESDYEREVSLTYYNSLELALQYATGNITKQDGTCGAEVDLCMADPDTAQRPLANKSKPFDENGSQDASKDEHQSQADNDADDRSSDGAGDEQYDQNDDTEKQSNDEVVSQSADDSEAPISKEGASASSVTSFSVTVDGKDLPIGASSHNDDGEDTGDNEQQPEDDDLQPTGADPDEWMACDDHWRIQDDYALVDSYMSHYQEVEVYYHKEDDDACLYLEGYLHTCASSRPHYHEVFVHYAARFVDQVKRVVFIGGGDSKVLHEVLKYPSLELVVGLELDQLVVRTSFKNFGTQPHWDDKRVEWYFGDAAKSLSVIPRSYYGSFDLVIVDILTEVAESLQVNDDLTLMEAAMLLMKPDGIVIKNEDQGYVPGSSEHHTKYAVDLVFHDVPQYCLQVFVAGSNTVDFLTQKPIDHQVETLYLKSMEEFQSQFDSWYKYGVDNGQRTSKCSDGEGDQPSEKAAELEPVGVLMILEAEDIEIPLDSTTIVRDVMSKAIQQAGLSKIDSVSFPLTINEMEGYVISVFAEHGYALARCIPSLQYCAFDIQLYGNSIAKLESLSEKLVAAIQSRQPSFYRFVTSGIFGLETDDTALVGPPSAQDLCNAETDNAKDKDTPRGEMYRKEKGAREFESPKPVSLHSYDNTFALKQWQSQRPLGVQLLGHFEVPQFWEGEDVLIMKQGVWFPATIKTVRARGKYDVVYENNAHPREKRVAERRLKKPPEQRNKEVVKKSLLKLVSQFWKSAEQKVKMSETEQMHASLGDGLTLFASSKEGTMVVTWDGSNAVSFNLFLSPPTYDLIGVIDDVVTKKPMLSLLSRDDFPRGTGLVVNFVEDVGGEPPVWA